MVLGWFFFYRLQSGFFNFHTLKIIGVRSRPFKTKSRSRIQTDPDHNSQGAYSKDTGYQTNLNPVLGNCDHLVGFSENWPVKAILQSWIKKQKISIKLPSWIYQRLYFSRNKFNINKVQKNWDLVPSLKITQQTSQENLKGSGTLNWPVKF